MLQIKSWIGVVGLAALAGTVLASPGHAETLNALFMAQAAYSDNDVRNMTHDFEKANPGTTVNLEFVPYEALFDKIVASKAAGGSGYDVVLYDVIWPAAFARDGVLRDVTDRVKANIDTAKVFDGAWSTSLFDGKYYGLPWILDTKYLFYNTDMLAKAGIATPPKTWDELLADAKIIKDKKIVDYPIVWSWSQAEAVVCDYATITAAHGGTYYNDGKPAFDQGGSLDAVKYMVQSLKDGVSNPNSKEYLEEDVRKVFSAGNAAFALNWTYAYAKANDPAESKIVGKVGVVPAPGVAGHTEASAVNGSMGLGITAGSSHPDLGWKYISFLTSQEVQNKYAQLSLPIWKSSYDDPAVTKGQEPLVAAAKTAISVMSLRPVTPSYQEVSTILQAQIQNALTDKATPDAALAEADKAAARLR
ncbi:extracellular solute-binding protein [Lichenihabitans psoromatis]|uniref:extracellular solute-binding protein n=1 Tax=Lichenihabitans psoromatis TaxID=2528642 RepID=UPI001035C01B|nr:extracellular solute-binding protein [Lichenihabitans psoromatis]